MVIVTEIVGVVFALRVDFAHAFLVQIDFFADAFRFELNEPLQWLHVDIELEFAAFLEFLYVFLLHFHSLIFRSLERYSLSIVASRGAISIWVPGEPLLVILHFSTLLPFLDVPVRLDVER